MKSSGMVDNPLSLWGRIKVRMNLRPGKRYKIGPWDEYSFNRVKGKYEVYGIRKRR